MGHFHTWYWSVWPRDYAEVTQSSLHVGYDLPIGTHFFHTETSFIHPTVLTFRGHFSETTTLILVFNYMFAVASSSTMPHISFHPKNEFEDAFNHIYDFLGISMSFSSIFQMETNTISIHAPSMTSIDHSCPRWGQAPVMDPSVDDDKNQMPEGVQALVQRSERLQL